MIYIADIANNHNGDIGLAKKMIDAALGAGADYVKFQIYNIDKFIEKGSVFYNGLASESLSFGAFKELKKYVDGKNGNFLATPFDEDSLDLLDEMGINTVKISSGDMNNRQLLMRAIRLKKELIISVGGSTLAEIDSMIKFLTDNRARFSVLHCILNYPARFEELNLNFIRTLKGRYSCEIGYSDHSLGIEAALAAIALGAGIIEKHFTIDRALAGGDNEMSIMPDEFKRLKIEGGNINIAMGGSERTLSNNEEKIRRLVRRKFFAKRDILKNAIICDEDLLALRPNDPEAGFDADDYFGIIGKRPKRDIRKWEIITADIIDERH